MRESTPMARTTATMRRMAPLVQVRAFEATGEVRIGLWLGDERMAGYLIPPMGANTVVLIDGILRRVTATRDGCALVPNVRGWDGEPLRHRLLPQGHYTVTVDQPAGQVTQLLVIVRSAPAGAA